MAATNVPARTPERQPNTDQNATRPSTWAREKKATRFVIKVGGVIPS